jgi:hypothetical protein
MRNASELQTRRDLLGRGMGLLGMAGLFVFANGCGNEDPNAKPAAPATTQDQQDKERAAREAAYGKKAIPQEKAK